MKAAREQSKNTTTVLCGYSSSLSTIGDTKFGRAGGQSLETTDDGMQNGSSALLPRSKIKVQLYPIDEQTRIGLEKDGLHPYLELTLKPRKRISSVLKHLNNKWGHSKVAIGDPVLFPYYTHGDVSCFRTWTMKDSDICAGDVYVLVGRPATFRLRYGWVSPPELKTSEEPSTSSYPCQVWLQSEDAREDCSSDVKNPDKDGVQIVETSDKLINDDGQRTNTQPGQSSSMCVNDLSYTSIGALLSEASLHANFKPRSTENDADLQPAQNTHLKTVVPWDDSLTNISIGGLLSEVSLQGKFNNGNNGKSISGNADLQSTQIISDSLDAFIFAQTSCPHGPRPPAHDSHTSILDSEETCHAFSVQKFSSSRKRVSALSGSSGSCSQDAGSKSLKFPKLEIDAQAAVPQYQACQEAPIDPFLSLPIFNDERSLGLASIKWGDSLGPFDLGLSASRKLTK